MINFGRATEVTKAKFVNEQQPDGQKTTSGCTDPAKPYRLLGNVAGSAICRAV